MTESDDRRLDSEDAIATMRRLVGDGLLTGIVLVFEYMNEEGETLLGQTRDTQSPLWKSLGMVESCRNDFLATLREAEDLS